MTFIIGLFIGGLIGALAMAMLCSNSYWHGREDERKIWEGSDSP